jgi:hypothetical protein
MQPGHTTPEKVRIDAVEIRERRNPRVPACDQIDSKQSDAAAQGRDAGQR